MVLPYLAFGVLIARPGRPRALELTATDELVAIESMDVLRQNGFEIETEEGDTEHDGRRCRLKLVAQPVSKATVFDTKGAEAPSCWYRRVADGNSQTWKSYCISCRTDQVRWCGAAKRGRCSQCAPAGRASWSGRR